jgi:DNA-binding CsgD family transcriptional regulator
MNTLLTARLIDSALRPRSPEIIDSPDVLALVMDAMAHGVIVVKVDGSIAHENQAARGELNRERLLGRLGNKIVAAHSADAKLLQAAIGKAAAGKRGLITLTGGGCNLAIAVVPLKRDADPWECRVALFFARADVSQSGVFGFFARNHGLTQTEELVLTILCRGLSTPEIAVQMKVAVSTVRSHVRSLCAKTGSSGVRELVNRVALLPAVAPLPLTQVH